ncbi:thermosome subunit beta [Nitrososphaera viennensis]|uniref:Archaeal thermosome n=2 Tax=Nitrososphaera viennensis TaxID=1034015 RepID=A0A060HLU1_9ARCH|nr:thermosome subunit beta [Nitrososphaera viennensis]AIC16423.1 archaeal thermosome [Nitrososphaera viennensis EN76]UVS68355.1 TCP-1/cpn60 chaperonin family protein [Nitrososphaera viennensis]
MSAQQVPIVVLKEGTSETKGNQAQRNNITAAKAIAEIVRTSLGPRGMDKMLVDSLGDVTITNDGATILKEIDVQHPAAKMMVEISKATDNEVGDGTTSTVVLAGSLLEKAEELITKNVHPTVVVEGFKKASYKAIETLREIATKVDPADKAFLNKIAHTSMASKIVSADSKELSEMVVDAVLAVAERSGDDQYKVDTDNIKVEKKAGGSIQDTKLIHGVVLDKEVVHGGMPKRIENAKIAVINSALEIEKTEFDAKININSPDQMQQFIEEENRMLKAMVDKVSAAGANVLLCQKGIDDIAQHYLAKAGIMAIRRIKESDMYKLSKATGARIINNLNELAASDLGFAKVVEERKVETDKWVFVEGCKNPKSVSILVRGGSQRVVDEAERSVHDAIMAVKDVVEYPYVLVGGGAPEALVSLKLREWAATLSGRAQLAAEKFADGIETIPIVLAENAGMDPLDTQVQLRSKSSTGKARYGIDVINGKVADLAAKEIYEPLAVKEQIINAATEAACMILRIDDVIASSKTKNDMPKPGGGPGGGGMGDMDM